MGYDTKGRWVPDGEAINWQQDRESLRHDLTARGLDWRHEGQYAFRTDEWGAMSETQRLGVLQVYDQWYDSGNRTELADEAWGIDMQRDWSDQGDERSRAVTYNDNWSAQEAFNLLTSSTRPIDWKDYTNDDLHRATIDELLIKDRDMFMGPGDDFSNAKQIRASNTEIQSWVRRHYDAAVEEGRDGASAEAEYQKYKKWQIDTGKIHNKRYKPGKNTRGPDYNQQVQVRKYKHWREFDEDTGTRITRDFLTGEVRDSSTYKAAPEPTRMTITGNKSAANIDEGVFYSSTVGAAENITRNLARTPDPIGKPQNLTIRKVTVKKPANIDASWKLKGGET